MEGREGDPGLIPRAFDHIFGEIAKGANGPFGVLEGRSMSSCNRLMM